MVTIQLLLVDDEKKVLNAYMTLLEEEGMNTLIADNGLEALRIIDEHSIDVIILDVRMPGLNGIEVLRKTKQKHPLVEVIMLTGNASVESTVEGLKLGAFDYLVKPIDLSVLVTKVNEAYAKKEAVEEKIRKAKTEQIISHPLAVFDRKRE